MCNGASRCIIHSNLSRPGQGKNVNSGHSHDSLNHLDCRAPPPSLSDMLRGQSFRAFGLTPKSRDSISEAEVAVEEGDVTDRVGSIGAKVKRQASQRASLQKSATERLQELYL